MGIGPGYRHKGEPYVPPERSPYHVKQKRVSYCRDLNTWVAWLQYDDYDRVMVTNAEPCWIVDPHFQKNKSILARFPATEIGYENALAFVAFMNGGECNFDRVPGRGVNVIAQGVFKK